MFEHQLAEVVLDPRNHDLPAYDPDQEKRMTSLSPSSKNTIKPLFSRTTGQNLLPEKLRDFFALRLADSNSLQRLGTQVDQDLSGTVSFTTQSGTPSAVFRDPASRAQAFQAHQLATKTFEPLPISISLKFPYHIFRNHKERLSRYIEEMLLSEAGRILEAACLTGLGDSGQPRGLVVAAEASGSESSLVTFPTSGVNTSSLQDMFEDLVSKKAGIEPDENGWLVGESVFKTLQGLSDPSGTAPLVQTVVRNNKITKTMMSLPLEVSSSMPSGKVLLANFKQAARILFWSPGIDILIHPFTGAAEVQATAQLYTNLGILREELVVLGS